MRTFPTRILLAALLGLLLFPPDARAAGKVTILKPQPAELIIGTIEVEFRIDGVDPSTIEEATVILDRRPLAKLAEPPWAVTIDAGEEIGRHQLEVRVRLAGGAELKASRVYEPSGGVQEIDVRLVNVAFTALDRRGQAVRDLLAPEVTVLDEGTPVPFERFRHAGPPLDIALVFDASNSMAGERLADAQRAALTFLDALGPEDRALVVAFGDEVRIVTDLATERAAHETAVKGFAVSGGTALYDAVFDGAKALAGGRPEARRVMVVLSDGRDEASSGLEPGSFHTLDEAIRQAHLRDVALFTLGIGSGLRRDTDFTGRMTTEEVLTRLASSTGGRYLRVERSRNLADAYRDILEELRERYDLAFKPATPRTGETWRRLEVRTSREGVTVRAREGYFVR